MKVQAAEQNINYRGLRDQHKDVVMMNFLLQNGQNLMFALTTRIDIMPELYTKKNDHLYKEVKYQQYLNKFGNTSFEVLKEIHCQKGEKPSQGCSLTLECNFFGKQQSSWDRPLIHNECISNKVRNYMYALWELVIQR